MWKVGEVQPMLIMGAEGKPLVSFAYASQALAEAAATHLESALLNAISVRPYAD